MVEMRSAVWSPVRKKANVEVTGSRSFSWRLGQLVLTFCRTAEVDRHSESVPHPAQSRVSW